MKTRLPLAILLITQMVAAALHSSRRPRRPPRAQRPQPEADDVVRITTNLVQVDAVITDKDGKLVTDLKPEEVEIYEDGREQKITNFSFNLSESPSPARDAKPNAADKNAPPVPPFRVKAEDIKRTIASNQLGTSMEPGDYVRQVIVTDALADKKHRVATQWMDFQIVK